MKNTNRNASIREVSPTMMMTLLGGRLAAISGFLILLSFVLRADSIAFYAFIAFAYIVTIPYSLWMRNHDRMRQLAPLQFLVDLVFVSGLVYFAGAMQNDFMILLYPLIILSAGIILPLNQTIKITVLAIIAYTLVTVLMERHLLIEYPATRGANEIAKAPGALLLRLTIFIFFGVASAYVSRRCDYISRKEKQMRELTRIIFKNVKTGLLLLDQEDRILMANDRACLLLGCDEEDLTGKLLSFIRTKAADMKKNGTALRGATDYFRRADGTFFPASIEYAPLQLPSEILDMEPGHTHSLLNTRILNFTEITSFLELQKQSQNMERIQAAATMASKMAQQIRTPLTAISGAAQLLLHHQKINPDVKLKEHQDLYRQIMQETEQMNRVIQHFLQYAEFSPNNPFEILPQNPDTGDLPAQV